MFGVVSFPDFELQAVLRLQPEDWRGAPVALLDDASNPTGNQRKCQIIQANALAKQQGVARGMTAPQGQARCEAVRFLTRSAIQERIVQEILLQWNATITPHLEATRAGICTLDLRGTPYDRGREKLWAEAALKVFAPLNLQATIGIAATPDLALLASQVATPICQVAAKPKAIHEFLRPLSLAALGASPEILEVFTRWGIHTTAALLKLPKQEVVRRLGPDCLLIWERARGKTLRPLNHFRPSSILTESMELEAPIERLEALIFILNRFLEQLTTRLATVYRVAATMELTLRFEEGKPHHQSFRIPDPTRDRERLFRMLLTHLEAFRSPSPIRGLSLSISPTCTSSIQLSLFETNLRDPNRFAETLAQLEALLGPDRVGTPVPTPSHRPDHFRMNPFHLNGDSPNRNSAPTQSAEGLPLRRFRPPKRAHITMVNDQDAEQRMRLAFDQTRCRSKRLAGPWKNSGNWWDRESWNREEWDVELASGGLYRVAWEAGQWVIDGVYD
tara:strand:- start:882 stop:2393 length:1512 start_codon:yes stop_codon:yes gene_type:complete